MAKKPYQDLFRLYEATRDEALFGEIATLDPPRDDEECTWLLVMVGTSIRKHGMPHDDRRQELLGGAVEQLRKALHQPQIH